MREEDTFARPYVIANSQLQARYLLDYLVTFLNLLIKYFRNKIYQYRTM